MENKNKYLLKLCLTFLFIFTCIFTTQSVDAVNLHFRMTATTDKNNNKVMLYRNYANAFEGLIAWYERTTGGVGWLDQKGKFMGQSNIAACYTDSSSCFTDSYKEKGMRFDRPGTINTNYVEQKEGTDVQNIKGSIKGVYYDVQKDPNIPINTINDLNTVNDYDRDIYTGVPAKVDLTGIGSENGCQASGGYIQDLIDGYGNKADLPLKVNDDGKSYYETSYSFNKWELYATCNIYERRFKIINNDIVVTDYEIKGDQINDLMWFSDKIGSKTLRMSNIANTNNPRKSFTNGGNAYKHNMDTGWKFLTNTNGFSEGGSDGCSYGYNGSGKHVVGSSALNGFDNVIDLVDKNKRKILVRYADVSDPINYINIKTEVNGPDIAGWGQKLYGGTIKENEFGKNDNSGDTADYRNALKESGFVEKYTIDGNQGITIAMSDEIFKLENAEKKQYKIGDTLYEYLGFDKRWNWKFEDMLNTKSIVSSDNTYIDIDPLDITDYTSIVFKFKKVTQADQPKPRQVYVNYIDIADTTTNIKNELSDPHQFKNFKRVNNQIGEKPDFYGSYREYYKFSTKDWMYITRNSAFNNDYDYLYYKTASGPNIWEASNNGNAYATPVYSDSKFIFSNDKIDVTIISFYYKKKGSPGPDPNPNPDSNEYPIKINGRLAFKTDLDKHCTVGGGVEYIPTKKDLKPYIEGAQKYILPNVKDDYTSIRSESLETADKSYFADYITYFEINVVGDYKGGEEKEYHNEFHTNAIKENSNPNGWNKAVVELNGSKGDPNLRKQPYPSNSTFIASSNDLKVIKEGSTVGSGPINIDLSKYVENKTVTLRYTGQELGKVKYRTQAEVYNSSHHHSQTCSETTCSGEPETCTTSTWDCSYDDTQYQDVTYRDNPEIDGFQYDTVYSRSALYCQNPNSTTNEDRIESVNVKYTVTLTRRYKLNTLPIYRIVENASKIRGISGDNCESVLEASHININTSDYYMDSVKNRLKTYYEDYALTKREIPTCYSDVAKNNEDESITINKADNPVDNYFTTTDNDFSSEYGVLDNRYNGVRRGEANIEYELFDLAQGKGAGGQKLNYDYTVNTETSADSLRPQNERINILTPVDLDIPAIVSVDVVNHVTGDKNINVIQKNAPFTITPKVKESTFYEGKVDTNNYLKCYYIKFDFVVSNPIVYYKGGGVKETKTNLPANTYIEVPAGGYITGKATNESASDIIGQFKNKIRIVAVANNIRESGLEYSEKSFQKHQIAKEQATNSYYAGSNLTDRGIYMDLQNTTIKEICAETTKENGNRYNGRESDYTNMYVDARYMVYNDYDTYNIGRVYDFKVTDCSDVNFKNVFRKYEDKKVNSLTGTYYYSGINHLVLSSNNGTNSMLYRDEVGTAPKKILPLGPYKNTDIRYIQAPKLGYRISFDLATTGLINDNNIDNKFVTITPSYYYIKKDGTEFNNEIDLYYKNNQGQYTKFQGSNYNIKFKPNDGYRTSPDEDVPDRGYMSDKLENLTIGSNSFVINKKMMALSNDNFVQRWYGEFKLPNSIIAVKQGENLNNRLTDGYIGVVFNIVVTEGDGTNSRTLSYNANNGNAVPNTNTSQWDYEGFLGFNNPGNAVSTNDKLNIQLESGTWKIDNDNLYNNIKGTVVLYDLDNRAATDFE